MSEREFSVVSLLALLRHNADRFCRLSSRLGQMIAMLTYGGIPEPGDVAPDFHELEREMEMLGLKSAAKHLDRTWQAFQTTGTSRQELLSLMNETYVRMLDDLEGQVFVAIPYRDKDLYEATEPNEDIAEAGKCLALGRYTATVFHLMRAMEASVLSAGIALNVTVIDKNNKELAWGPILANINDSVKKMPEGADKASWSEVCTMIYWVKQAWRNETMHPKKTYTEEEARAIFDAVQSFMKRLASRV